MTATTTPESINAHRHGLDHLLTLQGADGCWEGEVVWNTMILSQYVIVRHIVGSPIDEQTRAGMIRHYQVTQTETGGWGMHPESGPYVFFTTLAYVALRLLGVAPDNPIAARARAWLRAQPGGVLAVPTWGKFWLALIGLYDYAGVNPFPPEMFATPRWLPTHPDRLYCHTRNIYQAISYLYGRRFQTDLGELGTSLREELYGGPVLRAVFAAHRNVLAGTDVYARPSRILRGIYRVMYGYERIHLRGLRRRALDRCVARIVAEQRVSQYQGLSPVNGLLNCVALFADDRHHTDLSASLAGVEYWRWADTDRGIRYCGARSHTWDTAFALEAAIQSPRAVDDRTALALHRGYVFLRDAQLTEPLTDPPPGRSDVVGGWCFSDGGHRWPVSDCTAEAAGAMAHAELLLGSRLPPADRIEPERFQQAIKFILDRQNRDGGFGTYERRRAPAFLEAGNPAEMYANCMVEGSYLECTASALVALPRLLPYCGAELTARVTRTIRRGVQFLLRLQHPDGSFPAVWGVNFLYATFLAVRGLRAAGLTPDDPALTRAAAWVLGTQRTDGGWGEHYTGCLAGRYVEHPHSEPVMTSWALLALMDTIGVDNDAVTRGINWLREHQAPDGSWRQGAVTGVFFCTAMLDYRLYEAYFPVWACGRHVQLTTG
jgi:squalene/oxidosqualene cyclase-like protein